MFSFSRSGWNFQSSRAITPRYDIHLRKTMLHDPYLNLSGWCLRLWTASRVSGSLASGERRGLNFWEVCNGYFTLRMMLDVPVIESEEVVDGFDDVKSIPLKWWCLRLRVPAEALQPSYEVCFDILFLNPESISVWWGEWKEEGELAINWVCDVVVALWNRWSATDLIFGTIELHGGETGQYATPERRLHASTECRLSDSFVNLHF